MESNPTNPYSTPSADLYGSASSGGSEAVSPGTIAQLAGTKPWVRFVSVLLWIGVVFMLLAAAGMLAMSIFGGAQMKNAPFAGAQMIILVAVYGVMAFLYIYPAAKLWAYANRIGTLNTSRSVADLDAALGEQRRFWKFIGVMTVAVLCLYLVIIIGFVVFGATAALKAGAIPH